MGGDIGVCFKKFLNEGGPHTGLSGAYSLLDSGSVRVLIGVEGGVSCTESTGVMENESREVKGEESVEFNDGRVAGFEGEDHVPDGGSVEVGKPESKSAWGPIQNRHINGVGQPAKQAEEEAVVRGQHVGGEVLWCSRGLGGGNMGRVVVRNHVWKCAMYGKGGIMMFVSMLALP